jgi:membrane-bound lytic murein transglycosylase A
VVLSVAFRRTVAAVLAACAATSLAAGSEADGDAKAAEAAWKTRIVKDKTAAPSKASASKEGLPKKAVAKEGASKEAVAEEVTAKEKERVSKASAPKAGAPKASTPKTSTAKASTPEASSANAGTPKASTPKTSTAKASTPEASSANASTPKAGAPKAGTPKTSTAKTSTPEASSAKTSTPHGGVPWYRPVKFKDLPGWEQDDHLAAFQTFLKSCGRVIARGRESPAEADSKRPQVPPAALVGACTRATALAQEITTKEAARAFFEEHFTPNAVVNKGQAGQLTGYYEPVLPGSRTPDGPYQTPIYKRPPDLVNVVDDTRRGALKAGALTHVRKTETGTEPYYTRAEIDGGALKDKGLELLYLTDSVDIFFMQIQGSGRIKLTDGTTVRVHYDGKNGHPYSSIGRYLIEKAILRADRMSMAALAQWLRADPDRGKKVMWQNSSYVFFREIKDDVGSPLGAMRVPLTAGRSLAIDPSFHALGTPIYISAPTLKHMPNVAAFNRLMVGQDVGSAIKGAERGDIYFGSGDEAAKVAGSTKHAGRFFVLVPKAPPAETAAGPGPQKAQE